MTKKKTEEKTASIQMPRREKVKVKIIGETPYVGTNFSDETQEEILGTQTGETEKTAARKRRNIPEEVKGRRHIVNNIDCIPCMAFKRAMEDTAKSKALTNTAGTEIARNICSVQGDLNDFASIKDHFGAYLKPEERPLRSIVRIGGGKNKGKLHIAFRPQYKQWTTEIEIIYLAETFSQKDILNLLARAGITTGIGDTRPIGGGRFYLAGAEEE